MRARLEKSEAQKVALINVRLENVKVKLENVRVRLGNVRLKSAKLEDARLERWESSSDGEALKQENEASKYGARKRKSKA